MDTLEIDPTHKSEVRMYSRCAGSITELVFVDHDGHERIVCQWERADAPILLSAAPSVAPSAQAVPAWDEGAPELSAPTAPAPSWELSHLLEAAENQPEPEPELRAQPPPLSVDDTARRRAAKAAIRTAVAAISRNTYDLQMRYELALQARNRNTRALELFDREAKATGVPVTELIDKVIADRKAREDLMMRVYALQARTLANLDKSSGEEAIALLEKQALAEINGA